MYGRDILFSSTSPFYTQKTLKAQNKMFSEFLFHKLKINIKKNYEQVINIFRYPKILGIKYE